METILRAEDCKQRCVNSKTTCFGFEFRRNPPACFLMTSPHYGLEVIGAAAGFDNYRRRLLTKGIFNTLFVLFAEISFIQHLEQYSKASRPRLYGVGLLVC